MNKNLKVITSPYITLMFGFNNTSNKKIYDYLNAEEHSVDKTYLKILETCKCPNDLNKLTYMYDPRTIKEMMKRKHLLEYTTMWEQHYIKSIEIEISTSCNWRCDYCPVKYAPKEKRIMSMDLFDEIINKATKYPSIQYVTMNSYNEPTLDIYFEERIKKLSEKQLKLVLFTNGSTLNEKKIRLLKETGVLLEVWFNLPSLENKEFTNMTGSNTLKQTIKNIDTAILYKLNVKFAIQGLSDDIKRNLPKIKEKYEPLIHSKIERWGTYDRAGLLKNKYFQDVHIYEPHLYGCRLALDTLYIGVNGDCFICCQDYNQREVYANIKDGSIKEILSCNAAQKIRKRVFGYEIAPDDFLCRRCKIMKEFKALSILSKKFKPIFV